MDVPLLIATQLVADTVVTIPARDDLATATDIAVLVAAAGALVAAFVVVLFLIQLRSTVKELRLTVRQNLGPVSDRARAISENVEFITQALRTDVARLNESVKALTDRLHQASNHMEERIDEFNALMEVVQGEAEDIFIDTAATLRGVREGARSIGRPRETRPGVDPPAPAAPELDDASHGATPAIEGIEER